MNIMMQPDREKGTAMAASAPTRIREQRTNGQAPHAAIEFYPDVRPLTGVPTTDPEAALQFCQSLARFLATAPAQPAMSPTPVQSGNLRAPLELLTRLE